MNSIFIASSKEALDIAYEIKKIIKKDYLEIIIWAEPAFFTPPLTTIETLDEKIGSFDAGIFILTPDDKRKKGSSKNNQFIPRDNVIFELGMAIGRLGREKEILLVCEEEGGEKISLPSDLVGITQIRVRYLANKEKTKRKIEFLNFNDVERRLTIFVDNICQPLSNLLEKSYLKEICTNYEFVPAKANDIYKIAEIAAFAYGETPLNSVDAKLCWHNKNQNCFWIVRDIYSKEIRASISFLPLTEQAYKKLRNGRIFERELTERDIFPASDIGKTKYIYIEGLCNKYPSNFDTNHSDFSKLIENSQNRKALLYAFRNIKKAMDSICIDKNDISICAISGSKNGETLMHNLGFAVVNKKINRKDRCDFFEASSETVLNNISKKIKVWY